MEPDETSTDSEEETEKLKQEVYETQKIIQESGLAEEEDPYERLYIKSERDEDAHQLGDDPAPKGSVEILLLNAAEKGKMDAVQEIVKDRPDLVSAHDRDGYTPLHRACYSDHLDIVINGANVNAKTCDGWTPLHSACKWNNFKCAAVLIDHGAEINLVTNSGQTPLHLASSHPEAKETLYLLLSNPKTATNIRNKTGELASDLAHRHCKYYKIFEVCEPCFNII